MAGANLATHLVIQSYQTRSGNTDRTQVINEDINQVFLEGAPVMVYNGFVRVWNTTVGVPSPVIGIAGFAKQAGANLGSQALGAPVPPFGSVGQPGTGLTFGSVPYQTGAFNIAEGSPFSDGRNIFSEANPDTTFIAQFDNAAGTVAADYTPVATDYMKEYGLTQDASGYWYVDKNKATAGTNTVVIIVGFDPISGLGVVNGNVLIQVMPSITQVFHAG
jgi:hypothetical protein